MAQACNLELKQLATSAELSYPHLSWCNTWYIREDTLREANNTLVNYHYRQPLSQLWGGGMLSSSDGQRFPVKGSVRQINKGEALHSLRSHLCYANQGEIREQQDEQLHNQVGCLNLVTNAVIVWNSVYIEKVVQQLKQEGQFPGDEELKHIWPTRHAHINVYGRYHFNQEQVGKKQQLRELRPPGFQP